MIQLKWKNIEGGERKRIRNNGITITNGDEWYIYSPNITTLNFGIPPSAIFVGVEDIVLLYSKLLLLLVYVATAIWIGKSQLDE